MARCEDTWSFLSHDFKNEKCKDLFEQFLRGLFGVKDETTKIDSPESLVLAIKSRNWRAIEFLMGQNGKFIDATFPLAYDDQFSSDWQGR